MGARSLKLFKRVFVVEVLSPVGRCQGHSRKRYDTEAHRERASNNADMRLSFK